MKMLKRWLAFFVVVVLLIGVAFNGRSPIAASQIDEGNTTEGAAAGPAMEQQGSEEPEAADNSNSETVSYTHLDVYKRQTDIRPACH